MPTRGVQTQITKLYNQWKHEHTKSASEVGSYLGLYASDATIDYFSTPQNLEWLRTKAVQVRQSGTFHTVSDLKPLQWRADFPFSPRHIEILAEHRYEGVDGTAWSGQRRLVWEKQGAEWKIIEDQFPPNYTKVR